MELSSTNHGAVLRITFPPRTSDLLSAGFNETRHIVVIVKGSIGQLTAASGMNEAAAEPAAVTGFSASSSGGVAVGTLRHYFCLTVAGGADGKIPIRAMQARTVAAGGGLAYAVLTFDPSEPYHDVLTVRVATSLISQAQAALNLQQEVGSLGLDEIVAASRAEWRAVLSRAQVLDWGAGYSSEERAAMRIIFYSSLWRAVQFPRLLSETAADGSEQHWSPYTGEVHPGPLAADSGFWDAYHTVSRCQKHGKPPNGMCDALLFLHSNFCLVRLAALRRCTRSCPSSSPASLGSLCRAG